MRVTNNAILDRGTVKVVSFDQVFVYLKGGYHRSEPHWRVSLTAFLKSSVSKTTLSQRESRQVTMASLSADADGLKECVAYPFFVIPPAWRG